MSSVINIEGKTDLPCVDWNEQDKCPVDMDKHKGEEIVCGKCGWNLFVNQDQIPVEDIEVSGPIDYL